MLSIYIYIVAAASALVGTFTFFLLTDRRRFLCMYTSMDWLNREFGRELPNFLASLARADFHNPWPKYCNSLSAFFFFHRVERSTGRKRSFIPKGFSRQYLTLYAFLASNADVVQDLAHLAQVRHVVRKLADQDHLRPDDKARFWSLLRIGEKSIQLKTLPLGLGLAAADLLAILRRLHCCLAEHGFTLNPQYTLLNHLENIDPEQLPQAAALLLT